MKRISLFLAAALLATPVLAPAQDASVEERLNKLSAQIEDLVAAKEAQRKRIEELARELSALRQQQDKPNASSATQDDVKQLAGKLQEVDRKRQDDNDRILRELEKLGKTLGSASPKKHSPTPPAADASPVPNTGFEHVVQQGDTISVIVAAYKEKNIRVTVDQILKANPGLKPEKLRVGQKIFIPAPTQ